MGHRAAGPARHRSARPRYGRITSALTSVAVAAVALLGATGVLPVSGPVSGPGDPAAMAVSRSAEPGSPAVVHPAMTTPLERSAAERVVAESGAPRRAEPSDVLPAKSGEGRRVVFSISAQRVWLVGKGDRVRRTYLVSGSLTDNLGPGTYEVYSRSRHATGIDDSGTMAYMVRFTQGQRAAIGFHDIPVKNGRPLQTWAELGTPLSSGCIRQARPDARALWEFAPEGTPVVVLA